MHKVQVFPLIGLPQFNGWSQVLVERDQQLVCAMAVEGQNAGNIGRDLVSLLQKATIATGVDFYQFLQQVITIAQELEVTLLFAAALVTPTHTFYATFNGTILLKRQNKVGTLLSSSKQLKLIQGSTDLDDVLVLSTNAAQAFFGEIQQKATQGYGAEVIMNSLVSAVHDDPTSASTAMAFVAIVPKTETMVSQAPVLEPVHSYESATTHVAPREVALFDEPAPSPLPSSITASSESSRRISQPDSPGSVASLVGSGHLSQSTVSPQSTMSPQPTVLPQAATPVVSTLTMINRATLNAQPRPSLSSRLVQGGQQVGQLARQLFQRGWPILRNGGGVVITWLKKVKKKSPPTLSSGPYISSSSRRRWVVVTIFLLSVFLAVAVGIVVWQRQKQTQVQAAMTATQPLLQAFERAQAQVEQNPVTARAEMQRVIAELEVLEKNATGQPMTRQTIAQQLAQVQEKYHKNSGKAELSELPLFFDLSTLQSDFVASEVTSNGEVAVFVDTGKKEAIALNLQTKQATLFSLSGIDPITDVTMKANEVMVLSRGVTQVTLSSDSTTPSAVIAEGDSNREAKFISQYSDYIYLLNPIRRNIYRYLREDDQVSDPIGWLKPGQSLPYDELAAFKVDGDVWLTTRTGKVLKLNLGAAADFVITGLAQPFSGTLSLDTQEGWQNLYVLEPQSRRVVVIDKNGQFIKEVKSASLASATHLVAQESQGRVLAISGAVIFEVKL